MHLHLGFHAEFVKYRCQILNKGPWKDPEIAKLIKSGATKLAISNSEERVIADNKMVKNNDVSTAESGSEVMHLFSSRAPGAAALKWKLMPVDEEQKWIIAETVFKYVKSQLFPTIAVRSQNKEPWG
ncbi:phosphatidylinositol/phosphatidylcholine transfer protein SFH6 isoform X1 [Spinacia oleracea]|uniref:Phosphatidylinositol/phosphatidylcholine transfer protein SFH6 isoform X1 n=1 Tax=Spinacia oleracea TaxID=3562 RepID=A0ABM3QV10_SPIOL|nr:phosphatidylinositol/phosphatidylcholine transfer protein SFH6-like isoform X1 [Spinacia oleracea]XP_056687178.1 phosphatidylinositol/phosphatidylcholine transfer protein SFH6-like isoform X1 [Spinacia oleracea]XP_056687179.1 phosphatidylinositol/phosphatidylcholine transfer protein SFH6-like isoform X1 [Spinacia oleracea]XP_056687180.1 phosphatidylinositol/phosphatidylcholine transfer protein SFH6-like isoform X1 [Spinacia oleracea]XP_056687181.1 phosphatidylinositol/phosphatidylcholine tra